MSNKNAGYLIIDEIYLENEDRLREAKLSQIKLQTEIKNDEQMLRQEEEKKDPNRAIFHTINEHIFNRETDRMRKELFVKKEELSVLDEQIFQLEDRKKRLHEVKKLLYTDSSVEENGAGTEGIRKEQLLMIQEQERNRIAADLHDSTVQNMTALVHKVELVERFLDIDRSRAFVELSGMKDTIRSMIQEMRDIIYDLRPMSLENLGIWMSIKEFLDLVQKRNSVQTQFIINDTVSQYVPEPAVEINLFRMVQEAVNNSVKHSLANLITVTVEKIDTHLSVSISDNGIGIQQVQDKSEGRKFGLRILQERANILNAALDIQTGKSGTIIMIKLPLE